MNPNWVRWIKASLIKAFRQPIAIDGQLFLHIEGLDRSTQEKPSYAEFRVDGPFMNEESKGLWCFEVTINVLVVTSRSETDIYQHTRNVGIVMSAFTTDIPVYCLGNGPQDNPALLLGCFQLSRRESQGIDVINFGQVHGEIKTEQSMVEAHYVMKFSI